jgi:hypothetical protein
MTTDQHGRLADFAVIVIAAIAAAAWQAGVFS